MTALQAELDKSRLERDSLIQDAVQRATEELKKEMAELQESESKAQSELEESTSRRDEMENQISITLERAQELESELKSQKELVTSMSAEQESLRLAREAAIESASDADMKLREALGELAALQTKMESASCAESELTKLRATVQDHDEEMKALISQHTSDLAELTSERDELVEVIRMSDVAFNQTKSELENERSMTKTRIEKLVEEHKTALTEMELERDEISARLDQLQQEQKPQDESIVTEAMANKEAALKKLERVEAERSELAIHVKSIQDDYGKQIAALQTEKTAVEENLATLKAEATAATNAHSLALSTLNDQLATARAEASIETTRLEIALEESESRLLAEIESCASQAKTLAVLEAQVEAARTDTLDAEAVSSAVQFDADEQIAELRTALRAAEDKVTSLTEQVELSAAQAMNPDDEEDLDQAPPSREEIAAMPTPKRKSLLSRIGKSPFVRKAPKTPKSSKKKDTKRRKLFKKGGLSSPSMPDDVELIMPQRVDHLVTPAKKTIDFDDIAEVDTEDQDLDEFIPSASEPTLSTITAELDSTRLELSQAQAQITELEASLSTSTDELAQVRADYAALEERLENLLEEHKISAEAAQTQRLEHLEEITCLKDELSSASETATKIREEFQAKETELATVTERAHETSTRVEELTIELLHTQKLVNDAKAAMARTESENSTELAESRQAVEDLKCQISSQNDKLASLTETIVRIQAELDQSESNCAQYESKIAELQQVIEDSRAMKTDLESISAQRSAQEGELARLQALVAQDSQQIQDLNTEVAKWQTDFSQQQSELEQSNAALNNVVNENTQYEHMISNLQATLSDLKSEIQEKERLYTASVEATRTAEKQLECARADAARLVSEHQAMAKKIEHASQFQEELADAHIEIERLSAQTMELDGELASKEAKILELEHVLSSERESAQQIFDEASELHRHREEILVSQSEREKLSCRIEAATKDNERLLTTIRELEKKIAVTTEQLENVDNLRDEQVQFPCRYAGSRSF